MPISIARSLGDFMEASWAGSDSLRGLDAVVGAIAGGARMVQRQVQAAALAGVLGATGETNVQGEAVQKLDAAGSDIFVEALIASETRWRRKVLNFLAARNIPAIDPLPALGRAEPQPYFGNVDSHPNAKGHEVISATVAAEIEARGLPK